MDVLHRIFSLRRMAEDAHANKVGYIEVRIYAAITIGTVLLSTLAVILWDLSESGVGTTLMNFTLTLFMLSITLAVAWFAAGQKRGERFWYRFFSVQIPVSIYTMLAGIVLTTPLATLPPPESVLPIYDYVIQILALYLTWRYMKIAAGRA